MLPRRRGRRRREHGGRLLRDQVKGVRHVERVQGCWTSIHAQIRGVAQVPEVLEAPTTNTFVHEVVVLAEGVVKIKRLVAEAEEVRLRGVDGVCEASRNRRAQLILFCGRSGTSEFQMGSSRVYGVRAVI